MNRIKIIAAVAKNGIIGKGGSIPWNHPEDLAQFKDATTNHSVIMGRKTFESLSGPLVSRQNIVLTNDPDCVKEDVDVATDVEEAIDLAEDEIYVIGGASVYEQFLPLADMAIISEIKFGYLGDTVFPEWPLGDKWREVGREKYDHFNVVEYEKCDVEVIEKDV